VQTEGTLERSHTYRKSMKRVWHICRLSLGSGDIWTELPPAFNTENLVVMWSVLRMAAVLGRY
jgi:hypothetical protein